MVVDETEMVLYLSGGSGNINPASSLGGGISTTPVNANASNIPILQNLFPNGTADDCKNGATRNRCLYLKNNSASDTAHNIYVWLSMITPSNDVVKIYVKPNQTPNTTEPTIANEYDDPYTDVVWLRLISYYVAVGNPLPNLAPGQYVGIWFQQYIPPQTPFYNNTFVELTIRFDNY